MNNDNANDELKASMIESLLHSAYHTDAQKNETRIKSVLDQIASQEDATISPQEGAVTAGAYRWKRWATIAAALAIVTVLSYVFQPRGSSAQAMSAIERSIVAARKSIARKYRLVITRRMMGDSTREVESDLFVNGIDRIAIRYPHPLFKKSYWLGSDGSEAWLVPPLGPIRTGNQSEFGQWLGQQENISTPYLHFETILSKMRNGYRLEEQAEKVITLAGGESRSCRHIMATFRGSHVDRGNGSEKGTEEPPSTIELWLDDETGIALRLDARWKQPQSWGRSRVLIEYVNEPALSVDWFSAEGHYSGFRRKVRFNEN